MIKKIVGNRRFSYLFCAFAIFLFPCSEIGATTLSSNYAQIDLHNAVSSSLGLNTFKVAESVSYSATAVNESLAERVENYGTTSVRASVQDAYAAAGRFGDFLFAQAIAEDSTTWSWSSSAATYLLDFFVVGDGTLSVNVPYKLSQYLETDPGSHAFGDIFASLTLSGEGYFRSDGVKLNNEVFDGDSLFTAPSGTLSVSLYDISIPKGASFRLQASVYSQAAAVPEPSTMVLCAIGLAGLAFINRKNKDRKND